MADKNASGLDFPVSESQGGTEATTFDGARTNLGINPVLNAKGASYTAVSSDRGKLIEFTGAGGYTLDLTAAATLGDGWYIIVRNDTAGDITIDPNGAETIDGSATLTLEATRAVNIYCTGAAFLTQGQTDAIDGANKSLSNLTNPTAINQSLIPASDNTRDLGQSGTRFRRGHFNSLRTNASTSSSFSMQAWDNGISAYVQTIIFEAEAGGTTTCRILAGQTNGSTVTLETYDPVETLYTQFLKVEVSANPTLVLRGYNTTPNNYTDFLTITNNTVATCTIDGSVTGQTQALSNSSGRLATTEFVDQRVKLGQTNVACNANVTYTQNIDTNHYFKLTFTSDCTLDFTFNAGLVQSMCVELIDAGTYTVTLPAGLQWAGGTAPTFTAVGKDVIVVWNNGDNEIKAALIGQDFS